MKIKKYYSTRLRRSRRRIRGARHSRMPLKSALDRNQWRRGLHTATGAWGPDAMARTIARAAQVEDTSSEAVDEGHNASGWPRVRKKRAFEACQLFSYCSKMGKVELWVSNGAGKPSKAPPSTTRIGSDPSNLRAYNAVLAFC